MNPFQFTPALGRPDPDDRDVAVLADLDGRPERRLDRWLADSFSGV
jgi:hypothetical protein